MTSPSDTAFALRAAADEWADQGALATADLMREAAQLIDDLEHVVEMQREVISSALADNGLISPFTPAESAK